MQLRNGAWLCSVHPAHFSYAAPTMLNGRTGLDGSHPVPKVSPVSWYSAGAKQPGGGIGPVLWLDAMKARVV